MSRFASLFWANQARDSHLFSNLLLNWADKEARRKLAGSCSIKTPFEKKGVVYSKVSAPENLKGEQMTPLRIFDHTVTKSWSIKKAAEYQRNITNIIIFMEKRGKPLTIEYIDDDLNVIHTSKFKGNKKNFMEYEAIMKKLLKGEPVE